MAAGAAARPAATARAAAGFDAGVRTGPAASAPPRPLVVARAGPARPPQRKPVRLRWWVLALALLWVIWIIARPTTQKIDARIDKAIALANECKPREAQSELIALQSTSATSQQLARLQQALNAAAPACDSSRARARAGPPPVP